MKKTALLLSTSIAVFSSNIFAAGDPVAGKALHDEANCLSCHTKKPYDPAKTNTYEKLVKAVNFCNVNLNTGWFDDEVEHVVAFLNKEYYKLKQ